MISSCTASFASLLRAFRETALLLADPPGPIDRTTIRGNRSSAVTPDFTIRGAELVRPPFDATTRYVDVAILAERIVAIVDTDTVEWPVQSPVLDGRGGFLMPGLIDAHAHLTHPTTRTGGWLRSYLESGVTTVREAGAQDDAAFELARARAGLPPRILTAGWMLSPFGPRRRGSITEAAEDAVRNGARWLKAYALDPWDVKAVADVALRYELPIAAHLGPAARQSVRSANLLAIEHVFSLLDYELIDADRRRRARIPPSDKPIETWLLVDPTDSPLRDWIAELGARGVVVTPTLSVMSSLVGRPAVTLNAISPGEASWATADELVTWRERLRGFGWWIAPGPASQARRRQVLVRFREVVRALYEAGCPIAAGTDLGEPFIEPGRGLIVELRALRSAGLPLTSVLEAATSVPARLLGRSADLGGIAVGGFADLLLLDQDPRRSLDAFDHVRAVVAAGKVITMGDRPGFVGSSGHEPASSA